MFKLFLVSNIINPVIRVARLSSFKMTQKTALVLLSEGTEEIELVICVDVLRRAGIDVTVAGIQGNVAHNCSRQVKIMPDLNLEDAMNKADYDAVVLPGGLGGSEAFSANANVKTLLKNQEKSGRIIAAICAAPTVLKAHQVCLGKKLTSYPSTKNDMTEGRQYIYLDEKVVVDGNLITSRGPGTAFLFALAIVEKLVGKYAVNFLHGQLSL